MQNQSHKGLCAFFCREKLRFLSWLVGRSLIKHLVEPLLFRLLSRVREQDLGRRNLEYLLKTMGTRTLTLNLALSSLALNLKSKIRKLQ
jgi:hypothetical protein